MFFSGRNLETSQDQGKDECSNGLLLWISDWGEGSSSNRTTTLSIHLRWQRSGFRTTLNESPWVAQPLLCTNTKKKKWEKLPKTRCAKLVASSSKRLEAVIAAKGASTKYWARAVNTYVCYIFVHNFYKSMKNIKHTFIFYEGIVCRIRRKKWLESISEKGCNTKCGKRESLWILSRCTANLNSLEITFISKIKPGWVFLSEYDLVSNLVRFYRALVLQGTWLTC